MEKSLEDIVQEINNTGVNLDNLKERFGSNGQVIYDYANKLNGAQASAKGLSKDIAKATVAQQAHTVAVKAGTIALNAFIGLGIGVAISALISGLDALITTQDELDDKVVESKNNYESSKQALADVNTELENNQKQIDALLGKGKLTYVEQAELDKLKEANKLLEQQKKLKENEVNKDQRELAMDAIEASEKYGTGRSFNNINEAREYYKDRNMDYVNPSNLNNNISLPFLGNPFSNKDLVYEAILLYEQLKESMEDVDEESQKYKDTAIELEEQEDNLNEILSTLSENMSNIAPEYEKIKSKDPSEWGTTDKQIIETYEELLKYQEALKMTLSPKQYKADQMEKVFDTKGIEKTKKELVEMAKKGNLENLNIDEMPKLKAAMDDAGISAEDLKNELEAIADDPQEMIDLNSNILNELSATIETVTQDIEKLNQAIEESVSTSGLTQKSIENIISVFEGLDGYESDKLFENTANGIHLNAEELRKLTSEYKNTQNKKYSDDLKDLRKQYQDLCIEISDTESATERYQLINERNTLKNQIEQVEQLQSQFKGLTSVYTQWEQAMASPNEGDTYMSVVNSLEEIQQLYKDGLVGTDDFRASVQLMSNQDLSTASVEKLMSEYEKGLPKIKRYFQESSNGVLNFLKDLEKTNSEFAHMNKDGSWEINFNDEAIAKAMNLNVETVQQIGRRLMDYGFDINFDDTLNELYELEEAAKKATKGLDEKYKLDLSVTGEDAIQEQIDSGKKLQSQLDKTSDEYKALEDQMKYLSAKAGSLTDILNFDINYNDNKEELENIISNLKKIEGYEKIEIDFNTQSITNVDNQIKDISSKIENLQDEDGKIDLEADGATELIDLFQALINKKQELSRPAVAKLNVNDFADDYQSVMVMIQNYQSAAENLQQTEYNVKVGIQTEADKTKAQEELDSTIEAINNSSGNKAKILTDIGIKPGSLSQDDLNTALSGINSSIMIKAGFTLTEEAKTTLDGVKAAETKKVNADTTSAMASIKTLSNAIKKTETKLVEVKPNTTAFDQTIAEKTKTSYKNIVVNEKQGTKVSGSSSFNGNANAKGNVVSRGIAFAKGTWGAAKSGVSLLGELGREIIVRGNRWFTVGDNGAEFQQIQQGDIIFNHKQSEELLKNGKVTSSDGRGKIANVNGNVHAQGNAYFSGSGTLYSNGKKKTKSSSSKSKSSAKKSSKSSSSADEFLETWDYIEIAIERVEEEISRLDTLSSSVYKSWSSRNSNLTSEMSKIRKEIDIQNRAYNKYMSEANSINLSSTYKDKLKNGEINFQDIKDKDLNERMKEYKDLIDKAEESKTAVIDLQEDLSDAYAQRFENVVTYWEARIEQVESLMSDIETMVDMNEAKGMFSSHDYYESLIKMENDNITNLQNERNEMIDAMNEALESGAMVKYSENWYDLQNQINEVNSAILEANQSLLEFNNSIRDLDWEIFDYLQEQVSTITTESDFLLDLLSGKKMFDENGKNTQFADTSLGLMGINYNTYMTQADEYKKAIKELDDSYKNDPLNKDYLERRQELLELQQDSILNAEEEKQSIIDLIEDGYNAQLDALEKLIDKRKEALDAEKDLYDYQKEIAEKTKNIAQIEKQLSAYSTDDSEENQKTVQDLKNELQEAKDDLEETEYDKYLEDQEALLEALYSSFEEWISIRLDNVDRLISETITSINENSSSISETISSVTTNVGYTLSDSMKEIMNTDTNNSNNIINMLSTYNGNFTNRMTTLQSAIENIKANVAAMVKKANEESVKQQQTQQQQQSNQGSNYGTGNSKPNNASSNKPSNSNSGSSKKNTLDSLLENKKDSYPKSKLKINTSIVDRLKYFDKNSSFAARKKIWNGMSMGGTYTGSSSQNVKLINLLKSNGYNNGGTLNRMIKKTGEDGFFLGKKGEEVLSIPKLKIASSMVDDLIGYSKSDNKTSMTIGDISINMNFPNVQNYEQFKSQLVSDRNFDKFIKTTINESLSNKGLSLKKNKFK